MMFVFPAVIGRLSGFIASVWLRKGYEVNDQIVSSAGTAALSLSVGVCAWVCVHMPLCVGGGRGCCLVKPRWPIFPAAFISTVVDQRWWLAVGVTLLSVTIVTSWTLGCAAAQFFFLSLLWMEDENFSRACWTQGLKGNLWISESTRCSIF